MSNKRQVIVVAGALASLAAAVAVTRLLKEPKIRQRLGLDPSDDELASRAIDEALEESFPAITSVGGSH